ncbi:MAG: InlB B-repeat-containing protein [Oscillospiraceae bacterium]
MLKKRILSFSAALALAVTMTGTALPAAAESVTEEYAAADYNAVIIAVTLNPSGGTCSTTKKSVTVGKAYGTLPTPVKSGYKFLGWYTASGKKVTSTTVCTNSKPHTLYAHWEKVPQKCTIKFNPNGGSMAGSSSKTYYAGKVIGSMPLVRKDGYTFLGWYTQKTGGTRVTYNTVLSTVKDRTFYAHYGKPSFATLKYRFDNSNEGFGYSDNYIIPYSSYAYMFTSADARYIYNLYGTEGWGGNCFGMSSTSALMNTGRQKVQSFNKKQYFIKDLKLTDTSSSLGINVRKFIESMQVAQYSYTAINQRIDNEDNIAGLVNAVKKCQAGKGQPVVIGITGYDYWFGGYGHAVVGYKWKSINSTTERIYIYDCNWPTRSDAYITLKKVGGKYTGFYYDGMLGEDGFELPYDESISFYSFSKILKIWNDRGKNTVDRTIFFSKIDNAEIINSDGEICAKITDGKFESYSADVKEIVLYDVNTDGFMISVGSDDYTIVNLDEGEADVSYYFNGYSCSVRSAADSITLSVSEDAPTVEIDAAEGEDYEVVFADETGETVQSGAAEADGMLVITDSEVTLVEELPEAEIG